MFFRRPKSRSAPSRRLRAEPLESRRLLAGDGDVFNLFQTAGLAINRTAMSERVDQVMVTQVAQEDSAAHAIPHEIQGTFSDIPSAVIRLDSVLYSDAELHFDAAIYSDAAVYSDVYFDSGSIPDADPVLDSHSDLDPGETSSTPEAIDPWASIEPTFVDAFNQPVSSVTVGETVWLQVTIDDVGEFANRGIFSAYFDLNFGDADVMLAGNTEFNSGYSFLRRDPATHGWQAIGAVDSNWFTPDPDPHWLVRIPVQFDSAGEVNLQLNAPENWVQYATLLYGNNDLTPVDAVGFGQTSLTVIGTTVVDNTPVSEGVETVSPTAVAFNADQPIPMTNQPMPLTSSQGDDDDDHDQTDNAPSLF